MRFIGIASTWKSSSKEITPTRMDFAMKPNGSSTNTLLDIDVQW
jgi:hypothetical protein